MIVSHQEQDLCRLLRDLPREFSNRYSEDVSRRLLEILFLALAGNRADYLRLLFPTGPPSSPSEPWSLRTAQGAIEGAEYTEAARGHPCGHIFKSGEATYRCKTCTVDDTCVLCSKCFDASDHEGHLVYVSISPGNSGCCDCGDAEAWVRPVHCNIHSTLPDVTSKSAGKASEGSSLPPELLASIRLTIARALDYLCDVFSCSPEQLRLLKSEQSIREDEQLSRLTTRWYGATETEKDDEFALVLWNDEKHTVNDVQDQVARACKKRKEFGLQKANEVDDVGRSVVEYSTDVQDLLRMAKIIEDIKLTVTVRSSRDTFREQMCGTIVEWICDIAGCSVGSDSHVLRETVCEEMLKPWRQGSQAHHVQIGKDGIDDHQVDDYDEEVRVYEQYLLVTRRRAVQEETPVDVEDDDEDDDDDQWEEDDQGESADGADEDEMDLDQTTGEDGDRDLEMDVSDEPEDALETAEATYAGYPPPPPPPPVPNRSTLDSVQPEGPSSQVLLSESLLDIPKTPRARTRSARPPRPPKYWLEKPDGYTKKGTVPVHEDLLQRVRLDFMILYDLRMWKKVRIDLRDVYISTVVAIPYFKRLLGLRFAGLYTALAQLYLIADREPDHSIINLSLQMLTTPSITAEVVERGNFLTNLMAILYTFLTTRQVGYPADVNPLATLAFDAGAVTNRRMYHFFLDLKYLIASEQIQERLCDEERYLIQFLDLVKLHQGICPNVRAVGEHIEYETDTWIGASIITREINRLCRQFSEGFAWTRDQDAMNICRAIRQTAKIVIINSLGAERRRFDQAEIKGEVRFRTLDPFEFEVERSRFINPRHEIVDFVVEKEPMSFHHALHYTLSWLLDRGKSMDREQLRALLQFSTQDLKDAPAPSKATIPEFSPDKYLLAVFDFPLRVCAWLSQMRASMWIRNGITLRHQMSQYRGVGQRDVSYHRDIFLLQIALVTCNPSVFLATMVARFGLDEWVRGNYEIRAGYEDHQLVDVAEDFVHLLIILLSDRIPLLPPEDEPRPQVLAMRRDIAHILCFKPLSHSELSARVAERVQDSDDFGQVLSEMTKFRAPEGLSDTGTFELKDQYLQEIDPYVAHYSRNQRDEAENIYRNHVAKKTNQPPEQVVFEPRLRPIPSGVFKDLSAFTNLPIFAQICYYLLGFVPSARVSNPNFPWSRLETYLQFVLQLVLIAVLEDSTEELASLDESQESFVVTALTKPASACIPGHPTIASLLGALANMDDLKACTPKIELIQRRLQEKQPRLYAAAIKDMGVTLDKMDTASPAANAELDREQRKMQARERHARVMAQFKQQQDSFMENQAIDWGEDLSDLDEETGALATEETIWKYPTGTCILCQEETNDQRLYGTFAYITESRILRQTNLNDPDWVLEAARTPVSLDRSADAIRPFGVAGQNRRKVEKVTSEGQPIVTERQDLGKGFPCSHAMRGPITTGCGHIMHYSCFEVYTAATQRRHINQIARNHPERLDCKEFLCPLCKALGNVFLPIIWKGKAVCYPGVLDSGTAFDDWISSQVAIQVSKLDKGPERIGMETQASLARQQNLFLDYGETQLIQPLVSTLPDLARLSHLSLHAVPQNRHPIPAFLPPMPLEETRDGGMISPEGTAASGPPPPMAELLRIFQRIRDTMKVNSLYSRYTYPSSPSPTDEQLTMTDTLAKSLGFSITAIEISQRGLESEVGTTLTDRIPQHSLTHLRILSETVSSYLALGGLRNHGANKAGQEFHENQTWQLNQLFTGHPDIHGPTLINSELKSLPALLEQDLFVFLSECSVCLVPALHLDIHHVLRLCYLAEIVKVVFAFYPDDESQAGLQRLLQTEDGRQHLADLEDPKRPKSPDQLQLFSEFVRRLTTEIQHARAMSGFDADPHSMSDVAQPEAFYRSLRTIVESYALPFLRKSAILMHVRFGVEFPHAGLSNAGEPELQRLSTALRLPSLDELFQHFLSDAPAAHTMRSLASAWIRHRFWSRDGTRTPIVSLSHPAIFELVGLPRNYDALTDEAIRRRCPTTGKEVTDPCVCLFCGEIFCSQAVCCKNKMNRGGCYQHQEKCGGNVGVFINIRKCMVLFMNGLNGSWAAAPYLDKHGETDPTLRRHHQLFLNQKRYDILLRNVWLQHGIPSTIARRLEGDNNNGGWETM